MTSHVEEREIRQEEEEEHAEEEEQDEPEEEKKKPKKEKPEKIRRWWPGKERRAGVARPSECVAHFQENIIRLMGHVTGPDYYHRAVTEHRSEFDKQKGFVPLLPSEPLTSGITLDDYERAEIVPGTNPMTFHHFFITNFCVMICHKNEYMVRVTQGREKVWVSMEMAQLRKILCKHSTYIPCKFLSGKYRIMSYSEYLDEPIISQRIKKFLGRDFMASPQDPHCFPAWQGHRYPEVAKVDEELIRPFLEHVKNVICGGDEKLYEVEMKKNAWMFQNPIQHMGWATVLVGAQGTGKTLYSNILCNLWGDLYSNPNVKVKHVTDDKAYNIIHYRKLIVCNELPSCHSKSGREADWDVLKSRITDNTVKMRGLYHDFDDFQERNVTNYMFCTNNLDSIYITHDDRRFFVLAVSDEKREDPEYFVRLFGLSEDEKFLRHLLTYLLRYDTSGLNIHLPPVTFAKEQMIEENEPYPLQFVKVKANWKFGGKREDQFVRFRDCLWRPYLQW
jgi:hypothetical protein